MPRDDDYDDYGDRPARVPFPGGVKAAGIIWIAFGAVGLVWAVILLVVVAGFAAQAGPAGTAAFCAPVCVTLFALVFLMVGVQTVKGAAKSTLGNGIGSLIFGVLFLGAGAVGLVLGAGRGTAVDIVRGGVEVLLGSALLVAGTLALMGKSQYEEWRAAQGFAGARRRTQEERDYDDDRPRRRALDDEDRPRRPRDLDEDEDDRPRRRPRDEDDDR